MNKILRYLKVYLTILKANAALLLEYRYNFYSGTITSISWTILSIVAVSIYSFQASSIAGWSQTELINLTGVFAIVTGIAYTLFLPSFFTIPYKINLGGLDFIITKPLDSQFLSSTLGFGLNNLPRLIIGVSIVSWGIIKNQTPLSHILVFIVLLISGIILLYSTFMILITLNFYSQRLDNITDMLLELFDVMSRTPSDTFRIVNSWVFTFLLPLLVVVSFPAKSLIGKLSPLEIIAALTISIASFIISRKFWFYSLRRYESASS